MDPETTAAPAHTHTGVDTPRANTPVAPARTTASKSSPEAVLDLCPDIVFQFRFRQDRVACRYVNRAVEDVLGVSQAELLRDGTLFFSRCVPSDRAKVRRILSGDTSGVVTARFARREGPPVWLQLSFRRREEGDDIWLDGTARDVSEVTERRLSTRLNDERNGYAIRAAQLGLFDWDLGDEQVFFSERTAALLGLPAEGVYEPEAWFSRIHPDCASRVATKFTLYIRGVQDEFEDEHRLRTDNGYLWVRVMGVAKRDGGGNPRRLIGTFEEVTERKESEAEMIHAATHDALTGLVNRDGFLRRFDQSSDRSSGAAPRNAVLYVGLDQFKKINDGLGQSSANAVLREFAGRLKKWLNQSETFQQRVDGGSVARLGGDEFAVLFAGVENGEELESLARQILNLIATPVHVDGQPVVVTASVGVATTFDGETDGARVVENAQSAMYRAKGEGRSRCAYYTSAGREDAFDVVRLESDLRVAARRGELMFYYQPLIDLRSGNLVGLEALMRWNHHERGFISPARFIPIAEQSDLAVELGEWTLDTVCEQIATWERLGLPDSFAVNLNLSSAHFAQATLPARVQRTLERYGLHGSRLKLEITESALMSEPDEAIAVLTAIKALGVRICMDDFGTGYSSLAQLNRFPIDILKIDRAFVIELDAPIHNDTLARSIVALSQSLNLEVVAEGIETVYARDQLAALGCDVGQGYLFSRPVPVSDVNEWLEFGPDRCFEVTQRDLPVVPS